MLETRQLEVSVLCFGLSDLKFSFQVVSSGGTTSAVCDATSVSSSPHTMVLTNPTLSVPVGELSVA